MAQFFPAKGMWGKSHDKNGAYIDNGNVTLYKCSGKMNSSVKFPVKEVSNITHVVKFQWWLFLISNMAGYYAITNAVTLFNKDMQELASIALGRMKPEELTSFIRALAQANPNVNFDPYITEFINSGKIGMLNKRYTKESYKGCGLVGAVSIILAVIVLIFISIVS